jgi:hypothetical protein
MLGERWCGLACEYYVNPLILYGRTISDIQLLDIKYELIMKFHFFIP